MDNSRSPSSTPFIVSSPLWTRAPSRDENGKPFSDFMMLIPGLKHQTEAGIESCLINIKDSLSEFENVVVYVDLNIKLSLLWISHKSIPGITKPLVLAIQREIPHAKLITSDFSVDLNAQNKSTFGWVLSFSRRVKQSIKLLR